MLIACVGLIGCQDDVPDPSQLYDVTLKLEVAKGGAPVPLKDIKVVVRSGEIKFEKTTDDKGTAAFRIPVGIYEASASTVVAAGGNKVISANGLLKGIEITHSWENKPLSIAMVTSEAGQVLIKELYHGGCVDAEDPSDRYQNDSYVTLYNNSAVVANLSNLAFGSAGGNAHASNWYDEETGTKLLYENESWLPANHGLWYFPKDCKIEPYSQITIAINGAINHIAGGQTNSVDLSEANYAMYDPESGYNNKYYYPAPSEKITPDRYLKAVRFGLGNAWMLSVTCPTFYIFSTEGMTPMEFASDVNNKTYPPKWQGVDVFAAWKTSQDWVLDAVEVFCTGQFSDKDKKQLPSKFDAGYVKKINGKGTSAYRNVNKEATEAIAGNKDKLVYQYSYGTESMEGGTTDPSKIDAEASIKNGAIIVYLDTNNSTNDFHQRKEAALRFK